MWFRIVLFALFVLLGVVESYAGSIPRVQSFRFTTGMGMALPGGFSWKQQLEDAGYDDDVSGYSWLFGSSYSGYPEKLMDAELFFFDLSALLSRRYGVGLSVNMNQPFNGWSGYKESTVTQDQAWSITAKPNILTLAPHAFASVGDRLSLRAGIGPALHFAKLGYGPITHHTTDLEKSATKLGFMVRVCADLRIKWVRVGVTGQYQKVGSIELDGFPQDDPSNPKFDFDFDHTFVGMHLGFDIRGR